MWNLSEQEICLFSFIYISIYSIIHVLHCGLMDIYSKLRVITQYYLLRILLLLRCSNCFSLGFCVSLTYPQHCGFFLVWAFFENLLTFWPYKMFQINLAYPAPILISVCVCVRVCVCVCVCFPQEVLISLIGEWYYKLGYECYMS